MVLYSVDTNPREKIYFYLALISVAVTYLVARLATPIVSQLDAVNPAGWLVGVSVPSALTIFALIVALFDKFVWALPLVRIVHGIPSIDGVWVGKVVRGTKLQEEVEVRVVVKQTWSRISLSVIAADTESKLINASWILRDGERELVYTYSILPRIVSATNHYGEGLQHLKLSGEGKEMQLEGRYFGSKLRGGSMILSKADQ